MLQNVFKTVDTGGGTPTYGYSFLRGLTDSGYVNLLGKNDASTYDVLQGKN